MGVKISGCGKALPAKVVTNEELSHIVDTSDEWIVERTGIRERRIAVKETAVDLASEACEAALAAAGVSADEIDLIVCMTITPDAVIPAQACMVKTRIGAERAVAFDLNAACSGCIYGIEVASRMIEGSVAAEAACGAESTTTTGATRTGHAHPGNTIHKALVVGVERLSRLLDWTDRSTCVLFGDGAGAVVLEWDATAAGILSSFLKNTDDVALSLSCDAVYDTHTFPFGDIPEQSVFRMMGVSADEAAALPISEDCWEQGEDGRMFYPYHPALGMHGQRVFKFATSAMVEAAQAACERAGISVDDVDCVVPHQANDRIIRFASKKLGIPYEKCQVTIGEYGNTSASSVLIALAAAYEEGRIKPGDNVLLVGFGAGLTSGSLLFRA